jgi:archaellum component FlaD/FlaE
MDEELKLVKNEIKQVLLEITEHVLNIQNPFSNVVVGGGLNTASGAAAAAPAAAPTSTPEVAAPVAPEPAAQVPQQQNQGLDQQLQGAGMGQGGFPGQGGSSGQQGAGTGQEGFGGPQYPPGFDAQPPSPQEPTASVPQGTDWAQQEQRAERFSVGDDLLGDYDLGDIGDLGVEVEDDWSGEKDKGVVFSDDDQDHQDDEDNYDYDDEVDVDEVDDDVEYEKESPKRRKKAKKIVDDEPEEDEEDPTIGLDLVTLASLVQWTDRVVRTAGPEYLEALFEISEMTGRLSADLKNTLLVLVKLLSIEVDGRSVGATETVRLLAQLDGLMGNTTKEDARLLPFILKTVTIWRCCH